MTLDTHTHTHTQSHKTIGLKKTWEMKKMYIISVNIITWEIQCSGGFKVCTKFKSIWAKELRQTQCYLLEERLSIK